MTTRARAFYLLKKSDKSDFIWLFKIRSTTLVWILEVVLFWVRWWQVRGIITHYYLTVGFPRYPPLAGNMNLVSLAWWTGMEWTSSDLVLSEEPVCLGWTILTQSLLWNKGTGILMDMKRWSFVQCFSVAQTILVVYQVRDHLENAVWWALVFCAMCTTYK